MSSSWYSMPSCAHLLGAGLALFAHRHRDLVDHRHHAGGAREAVDGMRSSRQIVADVVVAAE
ncbi:hypothetical protein ABH313_03115, partial [Chromobacterium vaccinii]|uniref:hypothetical protein n=1 Tax=Chromobacterium vaccinii TaxID=1108595 RepID=UPI0032613D21